MSSSLAWSVWGIPGQLGLSYREILSGKTEERKGGKKFVKTIAKLKYVSFNFWVDFFHY